jgi:hypothetical protein
LRAASDQARRHLEVVAAAAGIRRSFEVRRGDLALHVTDVCIESDIVVVAPPRRMGTGTTHGFLRLRETVCESAASVLFLPPSTGRNRGPVVVVVVATGAGAGDSGLEVARLIAGPKQGSLLVLAMEGSEVSGDCLLPGDSAQDIVAALGDTKERLIVMTRTEGTDPGAVLAAARGVPVLVVEPI